MIQTLLKHINLTDIIIAVISSLLGIGYFIGIQNHNKQSQKSGSNSTNIQANGDFVSEATLMIKDNIQHQNTGDNSTNLQAQGDITIINQYSVAEKQITQICEDIVEQNIIKFSGAAIETTKQLFHEFIVLFLQKVKNTIAFNEGDFDQIINRFADPSMQYAIFDAQKGYATAPTKSKLEILTNLLIDKAREENASLKDFLLSEAIEKVSRITSQQLDFLSMLVYTNVTVYCKNIQDFQNLYLKKLLSFKNAVNINIHNADYLCQMNCLYKLQFRANNLLERIKMNFKKFWAAGFDEEKFVTDLGSEYFLKYTIPCLLDNNKIQINFLNCDELESRLHADPNVSQENLQKITGYMNILITEEQIRMQILSLEPELKDIFDENLKFDLYNITPLGALLGLENIKLKIGEDINWNFEG